MGASPTRRSRARGLRRGKRREFFQDQFRLYVLQTEFLFLRAHRRGIAGRSLRSDRLRLISADPRIAVHTLLYRQSKAQARVST